MRYLLFAFLTFSFAANAQLTKVTDSKPFGDKLRSTSQNITTLTSDFVQTKHIDVLSEDIESVGKFAYKKDNLLRWEYTSPFVYLIVLNKGKISIKDESSKNSFDLSNNKTFKKINDMITQSLQGSDMLSNPEYKHELYEDSKEYVLKLFPQEKKTQEFMQRIEISFSKTDYQVKRLKMIETSGDFTNIVFKNRKTNEPIPDTTFIVN